MPSRMQWLARNIIVLSLWFTVMFAGSGPVGWVQHVQRTLAHVVDKEKMASEDSDMPVTVPPTPPWAHSVLRQHSIMWCVTSTTCTGSNS